VSASPAHARPRPRPALSRRVQLLVALASVLALAVSGATVASNADAAARYPAAIKAYPWLKYGAEGPAVVWIQKRLGVSPQSGWYGPKTRAAVRSFQKRNGLKPVGRVNYATWRELGVPINRAAARRSLKAIRAAERRAKSAGSPAYSSKVLSVAASTARGAYYSYGGNGPRGFDCSGYVGHVIKKATGKKLPRTANDMRRRTKRISASEAKPGDLVFVHSGSRVSHVSIYAGRGRWYEASNPRTGVGLHSAWTSRVSYGRI
jgi:cell wall-associated NlpC family hydrolase